MNHPLTNGPRCGAVLFLCRLLAFLFGTGIITLCVAQQSFARTPADFDFDDEPRVRSIEHPGWFKNGFLDLREDLADALASGKRGIIVYFGQENCGYCQAFMKNDLGQADIAIYTQRYFDVIAIDIWGDRTVTDMDGQELTEREYSLFQETNFTPSLLFYAADGKLVLKLRGYYPPYQFRAALEFVAGGHYLKTSFREYLDRANAATKFEIGDLSPEPFFAKPPYVLDRSRVPAHRPLLVVFEQRDCHACDVMHGEPLTDEAIRAQMHEMDVVQLDMNANTPVITPLGQHTHARDWARRLGVVFAPTLIFFDEQGREIIRVESVAKVYRMGRVLDYVLDGGYRTGLSYQQWHGRRQLRGQSASSNK